MQRINKRENSIMIDLRTSYQRFLSNLPFEFVTKKGTWPLKAKVLGNANTPRSLFVESEKGSTLRRNRQDLLITNEKFAPEPDTEDIPDEPAHVSGNNANHDEIQQSKLPTTTGENAEPNTIRDDVLTNRNNYRRRLRLSRPPNRI